MGDSEINILNQASGAFFGALFAFMIFLLEEWFRRKRERNIKIKNEHALIETYLYDVRQNIKYNQGLLPKLVEDFKGHNVNIMNFINIPVREYESMKLDDMIFINKFEQYTGELKMLNISLSNINVWKEKIGIDLLDESDRSRDRGVATLSSFIQQAIDFTKVFDYHLAMVDRLIAENRVLLKLYKSWKFKPEEIANDNDNRKKMIELELFQMKDEVIKNPIVNDHLEMLKKYGLYDEGKSK